MPPLRPGVYVVHCPSCHFAVQVRAIGDQDYTDAVLAVLGDSPHCVICETPQVTVAPRASFVGVVDLPSREWTAAEYYRAHYGLSLPGEEPPTEARVSQLLREVPVRRVRTRTPPGSGYPVVDTIELWDGTRLHFAGQGGEPAIFRIQPPISEVENALRREPPR